MSAIKQGKTAALQKNPDDVVIVSAVRTAITRAKKGGLANATVEDLLAAVLKEVGQRSKIDPALVEDVAVGTVLPPGGGATVSRMALLAAGYPHTTSLNTSGLAAIVQIANQISTGQIDIGIGAGVESMTKHYGPKVMPEEFSEEVLSNQESADCLIPMGITSENVAKKYGISRKQQDEFAAESFRRAAAAQKAGYFKSEIVPVKTKKVNPETHEETSVVVDADDGIRAGVTSESLGKLKPAFSKDGSTHAGNASQVSDGAAAVLLARRSVAQKLKLPILGKFVSGVFAGVPPKLMGIGPAVAIPKLLSKVGISKDEIDFFEINEAFASQAVMSIESVGIPYEKVNINGGAIAMGHPLGATGSRQVATALPIAKRTGAKLFVTSMCVGGGFGAAALFVNEQ